MNKPPKETRIIHLCSLLDVLLESTQELVLLGRGLVCTVTELGGCIDPFEIDLLQCLSRCVDEHGLSESHDTLLNSRYGTLENKEVVLDLTISDKATHTVKELALSYAAR